MSTAPFDLARYVSAQDAVYARVVGELTAGRKTSHWIWFIFPQLAELGCSEPAKHYGFSGTEEARAYLAHPLLGPRLEQCVRLMLAVPGRRLSEIMPFPDDLKFISSMTLFGALAWDTALFHAALARFADGKPDQTTLTLLQR